MSIGKQWFRVLPVLALLPTAALRADMVFMRDGRMLVGRIEAQSITTVTLDPHALNPLYPSLGTLNTLSSNSYAEGTAYAHLGAGYVFPFLDIHAVDLRLLASAGKGAVI